MKKYKIDDLTMENIATYMDEEVREKVHSKEAPCSNEHFLVAYYEELQAGEQCNTEGFFDLLLYEFDINIEELQDIERVKSYDRCIISLETLQDLEKEYVVEFCVSNGSSGCKIGKKWYTMHLINGKDVEVYV